MKFSVGNWVEVTVTRLDGPTLVKIGKIVEATRDYAVADCAGTRFTFCDDTQSYVFFRRMTGADFARRRRR
jgi:hypothetical protein